MGAARTALQRSGLLPLLLTVGVLTASLAGGNTAVIKASSKSKACTREMQRLLADCFPSEYVCLVDG